MQELEVIVKQEPGAVAWNYEELKTALENEMKSYLTVEYTDDTIRDAQADVAALRKLRSSVENRRKEIKKKCLEPYSIIEEQAKNLTKLIDEPIEYIDTKVKDYEKRRRAAVKQEISDYMDSKFAFLGDDEVIKRAKNTIYDVRWENKTTKRQEWQAAVDTYADQLSKALLVLNELPEDTKEPALDVFRGTLDLSAAMAKAQELRRQKEYLLAQQKEQEERERRRKEQEEREKREAEARRMEREEAARKAREEELKRKERELEEKAAQVAEAQNRLEKAAESCAVETHNDEPAEETEPDAEELLLNGGYDYMICLPEVTHDKLEELCNYMDFIGISYEIFAGTDLLESVVS